MEQSDCTRRFLTEDENQASFTKDTFKKIIATAIIFSDYPISVFSPAKSFVRCFAYTFHSQPCNETFQW